MNQRLGIGVIGFGWMGQAHSRGCRRAPSHFPNQLYEPDLVLVSDIVEQRRNDALDSFGFRSATERWRDVIEHPDIDVVFVTAPNMMHVEIIEAAAMAGKHVFCEKPVGGTPGDTVAAEIAVRRAEVITGVGYNYRSVPLIRYVKHLIDDGALGQIRLFSGRFFSCYGADPLGLLSWRYLADQAGDGASADLLSHSIDLAHYLIGESVGPIASLSATQATFIPQRPLPTQPGTHYDRGTPADTAGAVTNEDYVAVMCRFEGGAHGTLEACRSLIGPQSQNQFEIFGSKGAVRWNLEQMNQLHLHLADMQPHGGYVTINSGEQFPPHGNFAPGEANGIGFEDLICIEDHEFLTSVATGRPHIPGLAEALAVVSVQDAVRRSWKSGRWEDVRTLRKDRL